MVEGAMAWARSTMATRIVGSPDGVVRDVAEYPLNAFRELVTNALVHRDIDTWSEGYAIEVRLRSDRLVISNPGGLYGITAARLGKEGVTSARNAWLVSLCQDTSLPGDGSRVIEALDRTRQGGDRTRISGLASRGLLRRWHPVHRPPSPLRSIGDGGPTVAPYRSTGLRRHARRRARHDGQAHDATWTFRVVHPKGVESFGRPRDRGARRRSGEGDDVRTPRGVGRLLHGPGRRSRRQIHPGKIPTTCTDGPE